MFFRGKVMNGAKRGRDLGFPTANIALHKKFEEGIYLSVVTSTSGNLKKNPALTFIGAAKTFNEKDIKAEVYILGYSGNLYGKYITVKLMQKIRDNKKFTSSDELVAQMNEDVAAARKFFTPWC